MGLGVVLGPMGPLHGTPFGPGGTFRVFRIWFGIRGCVDPHGSIAWYSIWSRESILEFSGSLFGFRDAWGRLVHTAAPLDP